MRLLFCITLVAAVGCGGDNGTGLCKGVSCPNAHAKCDPLDGQCKLDGTTTAVGAPCTTTGADPVCGADPNAICNNLTQDGFPGGYCSFEPCSAMAPCPIGSSCARLGGEAVGCFKNCSADAECRGPDYKCIDVDTLYIAGPSHKLCYFPQLPCNTNSDCPSNRPTCNGAMPMAMPPTLGTCR